MTHNLADLLAQGEGLRLEFKRTISTPARIARTLCAFANTAGGTLLIGVDDNGRAVGVDSEYREIQKIERATDHYVAPALLVSYQALRAEGGRKVLAIDVGESDEKPHYALDEHGSRTLYVRQRDKSVPTNRLILEQEPTDTQLWQSPTVRTLLQYLRQNDSITVDRFAQLVNISDGRAGKLLRQLTEQGLLLAVDRPRPVRYSLKVS